MRVGFVAASLATHLGVVGLAFLAFDAPATNAPPAAARGSGLVSIDLEALGDVSSASGLPGSKSPDEPLAPMIEKAPLPSSVPPVDKPATESRDDASQRTEQTQTRPTPPTAGALAVKPVPRAAVRAITQPKPSKSAAGDWLSIDQQLPDAEPEQKIVPQPKRDELVERLLAKEREKEHIERRLESERSRLSHPDEQPRSVADAPGEMQPTASVQSAGKSYQSADVWVELTRWLPRAASGDPDWERLSNDTRFDVQVRVRAVEGRLEVTTTAKVPEVVTRLLERTAHLMQSGRFAERGAVERRFALRIRLSQTAERELWIAHTTPDPPKPGVGSFVSPSGRRFDVWVTADP